jgi:hypothetical protein
MSDQLTDPIEGARRSYAEELASMGLYQHHAERRAALMRAYGPRPTGQQETEFAIQDIMTDPRYSDLRRKLGCASAPSLSGRPIQASLCAPGRGRRSSTISTIRTQRTCRQCSTPGRSCGQRRRRHWHGRGRGADHHHGEGQRRPASPDQCRPRAHGKDHGDDVRRLVRWRAEDRPGDGGAMRTQP